MLHASVEWPLLAVFLIGTLGIERRCAKRWFTASESRSAIRVSIANCCYWLAVAVAFNLFIFLAVSPEAAEAWSSGYVLEYTLSIDNLFVFQLLFKIYRTPDTLVNKALVWGIAGAAFFRLVFFALGTSLFEWVSWIRIPFGVILLVTAYKTARLAYTAQPDPHDESSSTTMAGWSVISLAEQHLPFTSKYDMSGRFVQYENSPDLLRTLTDLASPTHHAPAPPGRRKMTMLVGVVLVLIFVDVLFALDAVAAKVMQTTDLFINFTSSLFAMASFRSLYFVIAELTVTFQLLKVGIAVVLGYVGVELIISNWVLVPNHVSCGIILGICGTAILGSVCMTVRAEPGKPGYSQVSPAKKKISGIELPSVFGLEDDGFASPISKLP